jgi:Holliday junction resolvase RusA-like endonuclease
MTTILEKVAEYRFFVPGRAQSFRSPRASDYKRLVRREARKVLKRPLVGGELNVLLDYFHTTERRFDMDNIAKCVLEALNGCAYADDKIVRWQTSVSHFVGEPIAIYGGPVDLVKPLRRYDVYLFVRIRAHSRLWPDTSRIQKR